MRARRQLLALAVCCTLATGCAYYRYAIENVVHESCDCVNDIKEFLYFRRLGEAAWERVAAECPDGREYPPEYERGFVDGFADYLYAGGDGEPPATPPWIFRTRHYDKPGGPAAVNAWYAGFRHGAAVAMASGIRGWVVKPVGLPPYVRRPAVGPAVVNIPGTADFPVTPGDQVNPAPTAAPPPGAEVLPQPEKLPPENLPAPERAPAGGVDYLELPLVPGAAVPGRAAGATPGG